MRDPGEANDSRLLARGVAASVCFCAGAEFAPRWGSWFPAAAGLCAVACAAAHRRRPGTFAMAAFLFAFLLCGWARASWPPMEHDATGAGTWVRPASGARERARSVYDDLAQRRLSPERRGLFLGMVLGRRETVPDAVVAAMRDSGTLHLLAVSGMNVGFVAGLAASAAAAGRLGAVPRAGFVLGAVIAHAALVEGGTPVLRATLMAAIGILARLAGRRARPRHTLALVALVLLYADPSAWRGVSFQLSFAATASMMLLARGFVDADPGTWAPRRLRAPAKSLGRAAEASLAAQVGVLPVQLAMDGRAPLLALLPNLVCIPLSGLLVCAGLVWPLVEAAGEGWSEAWGQGIGALLAAVSRCAAWGAELPGARCWFGAPPAWATLAFYASLLLCGHPRPALRRPARAGLPLALAVMLLPPGLAPAAGTGGPSPWVRLVVFDAGQGEAALLLSSAGGALLVDGGPARPGGGRDWECAAGRAVLRELDRGRVRELDLAVLTHPHADHLGAIGTALARDRVRAWADGGQVFASATYLTLLDAARARGVEYVQPRAGDLLWDDGVLRLEVLHPPAGFWPEGEPRRGEAVNEGSLALVAWAEGRPIIMAGDLTRRPLDALAARPGPFPVFLSLVPHHGSRGAVSAGFVARARPRWAVVSAGRANRFGFPHVEAMAAWRAAGARTWVTGRDGTLRVEFRSGRAIVRDARGRRLDEARPPPPAGARGGNP